MPNPTTCPECGSTPMGSTCYHICPNSDFYYSPEQERYDDAFYGDDDVRERYAADLDGLDDPADYMDDEKGPEGWTRRIDNDNDAVVDRYDAAEDIPF
jgi:hypothetical protein